MLPGAGGQTLVVGNGRTTKTWSAADLAVHVTGPATANIGTTITYRIEFANPGDLAAKDVTATVDVPDGLSYVGANPTAETPRQLRWRLGDLGPRQRRSIDVNFRTDRQASAAVCCDATAAGGLRARLRDNNCFISRGAAGCLAAIGFGLAARSASQAGPIHRHRRRHGDRQYRHFQPLTDGHQQGRDTGASGPRVGQSIRECEQ